MAFKKKILLNADTIQILEEGSPFQGYFIGSKTLPSGLLHIFSTEKGTTGLWGARMLNDLLSTVKPGEMVRVTYLEKKSLGNGKTMKIYDVESDDTNTIDVSSVSKGSNVSYQEAGEDLGAEDLGSEEEVDEGATAEPVRRGHAQATAAAANTAKAFFRKK